LDSLYIQLGHDNWVGLVFLVIFVHLRLEFAHQERQFVSVAEVKVFFDFLRTFHLKLAVVGLVAKEIWSVSFFLVMNLDHLES
jgi:hypothetical protein